MECGSLDPRSVSHAQARDAEAPFLMCAEEARHVPALHVDQDADCQCSCIDLMDCDGVHTRKHTRTDM